MGDSGEQHATEQRLADLASDLVARARKAGADVAEATARAGWELSARVRLGEPELVEEAGHRGVALRVMRDSRVAVSSTSDLDESGLARCVADAIELLELSEPDPFAGPADPAELARDPDPELDTWDPAVAEIDAEQALARASAGEAAARAHDPRITLSEGATFSRTTGVAALALGTGFRGVQRGSYASLSVVPLAEDEGGKRRRGHYWTAARHLEDLEPDDEVGREAARRTLAKLGARKVASCEAPVVFDPDAARGILGTFAGCVMGSAIWRKASYLVGREGTRVASELVTIVDDPLLPRAPGSRPFDGEGLRSRRNLVVERGILRTYLCDCYAARKLERRSTASAARSGGSVGPGTTNFLLEKGALSREQLLGATPRGLYVTEMMGFGFNPVTGDFSRGASGFWIEGGELAFPVTEVTISSSLGAMLEGVDAVADDLLPKTATAAPTFRVASMTIAGT
jgi:PmbA protein